MPILFILRGIAVATGLYGAKNSYDVYEKMRRLIHCKKESRIFLIEQKKIEGARKSTQNSLEDLGRAKMHA